MHQRPKPTSPSPYCSLACQAGIRAWTVAVVAVLAALLFLSYPAPPADAQEAEKTPGVEVGDGTVRVGDDVFAGDGCARAGDVVAGDCDEDSQAQQGSEPANDAPKEKAEQEESTSDEEKPSNDNSGETTIQEEITAPETTGGGTTVQEDIGAEPTEGGTTAFSGGATQAGTTSDATSDDIESCPADPPDDATQATVARAVDGDTVELKEPVDGYDRVRLIGVNTLEMEDEDGSPEPGAQEASEFTADALEERRGGARDRRGSRRPLWPPPGLRLGRTRDREVGVLQPHPRRRWLRRDDDRRTKRRLRRMPGRRRERSRRRQPWSRRRQSGG